MHWHVMNYFFVLWKDMVAALPNRQLQRNLMSLNMKLIIKECEPSFNESHPVFEHDEGLFLVCHFMGRWSKGLDTPIYQWGSKNKGQVIIAREILTSVILLGWRRRRRRRFVDEKVGRRAVFGVPLGDFDHRSNHLLRKSSQECFWLWKDRRIWLPTHCKSNLSAVPHRHNLIC